MSFFENFTQKPTKIQKAYLAVILLDEYSKLTICGGCLHAIIDDGNYNNYHVNDGLEYAIEKNDFFGQTIARLLLDFTEDERQEIIEEPLKIESLVEYGEIPDGIKKVFKNPTSKFLT